MKTQIQSRTIIKIKFNKDCLMYPGLHDQGHLFHLPVKAGTELEVKKIMPTYMQFGINNPRKKCLLFDLTYLRSKYPGQGFSRKLWVVNVDDFDIVNEQ